MIDRDKTLENVLAFLTEKFPDAGDDLKGSTQLMSSVLLDSLATMEIILFIEEKFGLSLERSDLDSFDTPDNITDLILRKQGAR